MAGADPVDDAPNAAHPPPQPRAHDPQQPNPTHHRPSSASGQSGGDDGAVDEGEQRDAEDAEHGLPPSRPIYPDLPHLEGPLADSQDTSQAASDTDSALGDFVSTRSESVTASVYAFRNENGRRYHAYRDGVEYNLPNDEQELDRLDLQHQLFYMTLNGSLHRSPLDQLPNGVQDVLDVGTGTGIWAIDFADKHPSARVIGTDISPTQPNYVPPNCHFYVDDATADWTFDHSFDFVHGRMVVVAFKDWPKFFAQAYEALNPGGWVEIQDLNFPLRCDDGSAPPDCAGLQWGRYMIEGAAKLGVNLRATDDFPRMMAEAGFVDVQAERFAWPLGRWPKDRKEKEKGVWMLQNVLEGLQGFSMSIFTKGLGWRSEEVEVHLAEVRKDWIDRKKHLYLPMGVFYARKPL